MGYVIRRSRAKLGKLVRLDDVDVTKPPFNDPARYLVDPPLPEGVDILYLKIDENDNVVEMTAEEKVEARDKLPLRQAQGARHTEINNRTGEVVAAGFTYNGKVFSLSIHAQLNIIGAMLSKDTLTYPLKWPTLDDMQFETIADATELQAFHDAAFAAKRSGLDAGVSLKESVTNAADADAANAITDNR